jgi:signal transduction histidine kinase
MNANMAPLAAPPKLELRLYVAGPASRSAHAVRSLQTLCEEHFPERFDLEIVDVSSIPRGAVVLRREHVEVSAVVRRAVESSRPLLDAAGHSLQVLLSAEPLRVDVDPTRFEQILVNVLHNAAKYTPPRGRIVVSAKQSGGEAVVRVRDDGVGIAPELLPRVFDLFVQGDRSLGRAQGGRGIGLTLVKSLVEMHGGTVEAHSEGVGRGAEIVVRLPLAAAAAGG